MDTYPYYEYQKDNDISNAKDLFWAAYDKTKAAAGGKEVWITETGWPVSGETEGQGVPSAKNAGKYWQDIVCELEGSYNLWYFTMQDALPDTPSPSFGFIGQDINSDPLFSLSCKNTTSSSSSSSSASSTRTTHRHGHATAAASGTASSHAAGGAYATGSAGGHAGNSTGPIGTGAGASYGAGSGPTPTAGAGAGSSASGAPIQSQTGNSAAKAGSAMGAGLLAFFGLAAAL